MRPSRTMQMASWLKDCGTRSSPARACLLLALLCAGCDAILAPLVAQEPRLGGQWTGRIVPVEVHDYNGNFVYSAAALELTGGTHFEQLRGANPPEIGGGHKPLLAVRDKSHEAVIIDPSKLPIGHEVEVRGSMMVSRIFKPADAPPSGAVGVSRAAPSARDRNEHFIELSGQPKVVGN